MERTETAVAKELGRAHKALLSTLRGLEWAVGPSSGEGVSELRARLELVDAHLTDHFRFEEQNGYMEAVRKREPRLERVVEQLAEEHRQLTRSLDSLIGQARAASTQDEILREGVRAWVEQVRRHERRENSLVQEAFNLDIGAED